MTDNTLDVKVIRERAERATPGPWINREPLKTWIDSEACCERGAMHVADVRGWGHLTGRGHGAHGMDEKTAIAILEANGDFIAHARTDIPALLKELDRLTSELERARGALAEERAACLAIATEHSSPPFGHSDPEYRRAWHDGERSAATEIAEEIQNRSILNQ